MQYGLIGKKLTHSFSAEIHKSISGNDYELKELDENQFDIFFQNKDFCGVNITIPYKKSVIKYIDYLDENAKTIGAVNTVVNKSGKLYGYNTDYMGLEALIDKNNVTLKDKNILILGSGGTSNTAFVLAKNKQARKITVMSRKSSDNCDTYDNISSYYDSTDIIINTTPVGMFPNTYDSVINVSEFNNLEAVFDAVYNPISSSLVIKALNAGVKSEGGLYMLISQAYYTEKLFCEKDFSSSIIDKIFAKTVKEKQNIVLIGMPGCGKTTIGKKLSTVINKDFIDTDNEIIKKYNTTPKEIIENNGESYFRRIENDVIRDISKFQGKVIATGGGAVLNPENIELLKMNGTIIFIDKRLNDLKTDDSRPLSSNQADLEEVYNSRINVYNKYADFVIKATDDFNDNLSKLLKVI